MQIIILGAGTSIPAPRHSPAGIYVRVGREHLLFDAGPGTLQRLHRIGVSPHQVDRVFLTHYHLDHCLDLATLLFALRIPQPARTKPLTVYGPKGLKRLYRQLNHAFKGWLEPRGYRLTLYELGESTVQLRGYAVRTKRMHHSTSALGYRLSLGVARDSFTPLRGDQSQAAGRCIVYSGDTDACRNIVELGHKADLLILECSHPDARKVAGHLTPTECGRIAAAARCRHLLLTHFYPVFQGYDIRSRVRRHFRGRLTLARDFTQLTV